MADLISMLSAAAGASTGNPNAWDISYAVYDASPVAGDVSKAWHTGRISPTLDTQEAQAKGMFISTDGTKFYFIGTNNDTVYQYTMSSPWIVNTAVYDSKSFSVNAQETEPNALFFKTDGTKMYVLGATGQDVNEYSLSTAWDVSSASYVQNFSIATEETQPRGLFFKPDGTKMYVLGLTGDDVNEYDLSSAWDISTASYVQNFSIAAQETLPTGLSFLGDGTKMYIIGVTGDDVNEYSLSTPWDISTASYVQVFSVSAQATEAEDLFFKPDGSMFFVLIGKNASGVSESRVFQYGIGGFSVAAQETNPSGLFFKPDGTKMYVSGTTGDDVNEYDLSTAWDITTASYVQNFSFSLQDGNPANLFFKSDGTKMYFVGYSNKKVYEYDLSTPWDVSTASFVQDFSVSSQDATPTGLFFKDDGTKMYVSGYGNDKVYEYNLSSAWNISTASFLQDFSVSSQDTTPRAVFFKPDGTKMYVLGAIGDDVNEYDLSTPWDISSASYVQNYGVLDSNPTGIFWRDNGEEFFIVGSGADQVQKYAISST